MFLQNISSHRQFQIWWKFTEKTALPVHRRVLISDWSLSTVEGPALTRVTNLGDDFDQKGNNDSDQNYYESTCSKNDNPTKKQPKHVPAAETCSTSKFNNMLKFTANFITSTFFCTSSSGLRPDLSINSTPNNVMGTCRRSSSVSLYLKKHDQTKNVKMVSTDLNKYHSYGAKSTRKTCHWTTRSNEFILKCYMYYVVIQLVHISTISWPADMKIALA